MDNKTLETKIDAIIINGAKGIEEMACDCDTCSESRGVIVKNIVELIQSEKKAYANELIGKDEKTGKDCFIPGDEDRVIRNEFREELRQLNKLDPTDGERGGK